MIPDCLMITAETQHPLSQKTRYSKQRPYKISDINVTLGAMDPVHLTHANKKKPLQNYPLYSLPMPHWKSG
jgi:hypothetical protein